MDKALGFYPWDCGFDSRHNQYFHTSRQFLNGGWSGDRVWGLRHSSENHDWLDKSNKTHKHPDCQQKEGIDSYLNAILSDGDFNVGSCIKSKMDEHIFSQPIHIVIRRLINISLKTVADAIECSHFGFQVILSSSIDRLRPVMIIFGLRGQSHALLNLHSRGKFSWNLSKVISNWPDSFAFVVCWCLNGDLNAGTTVSSHLLPPQLQSSSKLMQWVDISVVNCLAFT